MAESQHSPSPDNKDTTEEILLEKLQEARKKIKEEKPKLASNIKPLNPSKDSDCTKIMYCDRVS